MLGFLALLLLFSPATATSGGEGSIHDVLKSHGLPAGLLPRTVQSYTLDPATGRLKALLDRPCYTRFDGPAHFDQVIQGNLSYGQFNGVVGVAQEELFLWLPVIEMKVSDPGSGVILFDIGGMAHKQLSLSLFEVPPECQPDMGSVVDFELGLSDSKQGKGAEFRDEKKTTATPSRFPPLSSTWSSS